jgi:hypothetical protein
MPRHNLTERTMTDDSRKTETAAERETRDKPKLDKETVRDLTPPEEQAELVKGGCARMSCKSLSDAV